MLEGVILGDRYQLIEKIGGGGMAVVYKARCNVLNRYVAVKVLRHDYINDHEIVERFKAEAQAAAKLSHPNIVSVYDVGEEGSYLYFVMECIQGVTLKTIIEQEGVLHYEDVIHFGIQIAGALAHAHDSGIIHRDIKPHNIMVTDDGIAKVTDFGIARATNTASTLTNLGNAIGSVHYFSPEQATSGEVDAKSDIYSLGITLFEMATGKVPFDGESPVAIALKHLNEPATAAKVINDDVPLGLNDVIMKCIRKDPANRYQNCDALIKDLYDVLENPHAPLSELSECEKTKVNNKKIGGSDNTDGDDLYQEVLREKQQKKERAIDRKSNKSSDKLSGMGNKLAKKKGFIIGGIATVFILVVIAILIPLTKGSNAELGRIKVGNYVGMTYDEVWADLQSDYEKDWSWIQAQVQQEVQPDPSVAPGVIVSQDPAEGAEIQQGGTQKLVLVVSSGLPTSKIPSHLGKTYEAYVEELNALGFVVAEKPTRKNSEVVEKGAIIETVPASGTDEVYDYGTPVEIVVSKGPEIVKVETPRLIGKTYKEAKALIEKSGLVLGDVSPSIDSDDMLLVEEQSTAEGEEVEEGASIDLVLQTTSATHYTVDASQFDNATNSQNVSLATVLQQEGVDYSTTSFSTTVSYTTSKSSTPVSLKKGRVAYDDLPLAFTEIHVPINGYVTVTITVVYDGTTYTFKDVVYDG